MYGYISNTPQDEIADGAVLVAVQSDASYGDTDESVRDLWFPVPDEVVAGAVMTDGEWVNPEPQEASGPRIMPKALFVLRIPFPKLVAIRAKAAEASPDGGAVATWLYVLDMLVDIDLSDPNTAEGLDLLMSLGLITEDDKVAALA